MGHIKGCRCDGCRYWGADMGPDVCWGADLWVLMVGGQVQEADVGGPMMGADVGVLCWNEDIGVQKSGCRRGVRRLIGVCVGC